MQVRIEVDGKPATLVAATKRSTLQTTDVAELTAWLHLKKATELMLVHTGKDCLAHTLLPFPLEQGDLEANEPDVRSVLYACAAPHRSKLQAFLDYAAATKG